LLFSDATQLSASLCVLPATGSQDRFQQFIVAAAVLADVEIGFEITAQLIQQAALIRQDRHQFHPAHVAANQHRFVAVVLVFGGDQIHGNGVVFAFHQPVVDFVGNGVVVVVVFKAHLAGGAQHVVKDDPVQLLQHLGVAHLNAFDLLFHIFFLVGEELVDLAVALQIALALQVDQRIFDPLLVAADVEVGLIDQQDGDVARRALELRYPLEQEQGFEDAQLQIGDLVLGGRHRLLFVGAHHLADAVVKLIEAGQLPHR